MPDEITIRILGTRTDRHKHVICTQCWIRNQVRETKSFINSLLNFANSKELRMINLKAEDLIKKGNSKYRNRDITISKIHSHLIHVQKTPSFHIFKYFYSFRQPNTPTLFNNKLKGVKYTYDKNVPILFPIKHQRNYFSSCQRCDFKIVGSMLWCSHAISQELPTCM